MTALAYFWGILALLGSVFILCIFFHFVRKFTEPKQDNNKES